MILYFNETDCLHLIATGWHVTLGVNSFLVLPLHAVWSQYNETYLAGTRSEVPYGKVAQIIIFPQSIPPV